MAAAAHAKDLAHAPRLSWQLREISFPNPKILRGIHGTFPHRTVHLGTPRSGLRCAHGSTTADCKSHATSLLPVLAFSRSTMSSPAWAGLYVVRQRFDQRSPAPGQQSVPAPAISAEAGRAGICRPGRQATGGPPPLPRYLSALGVLSLLRNIILHRYQLPRAAQRSCCTVVAFLLPESSPRTPHTHPSQPPPPARDEGPYPGV